MFTFIIEVIIVSILVSIFASWTRMIPRYPKRKHRFIQQTANSLLLTVLITLVVSLEIYPSWILLFVIILFILWISIQFTNGIAHKSGELTTDPSKTETTRE